MSPTLRNAVFKRRIDEIGPMIVVFQDIKVGKNVKGVDAEEIRSGRVTVTQRAENIEGMTGASEVLKLSKCGRLRIRFRTRH